MRTVHRFFIPDGTWYDFVTGKKFPGNKKYISFFKEYYKNIIIMKGDGISGF